MSIVEMFSELKINLKNMSEYLGVRPNTISNKMSQGYDFTEGEMAKLKEYLDLKIREMIKIMKRIDKVLDSKKAGYE